MWFCSVYLRLLNWTKLRMYVWALDAGFCDSIWGLLNAIFSRRRCCTVIYFILFYFIFWYLVIILFPHLPDVCVFVCLSSVVLVVSFRIEMKYFWSFALHWVYGYVVFKNGTVRLCNCSYFFNDFRTVVKFISFDTYLQCFLVFCEFCCTKINFSNCVIIYF